MDKNSVVKKVYGGSFARLRVKQLIRLICLSFFSLLPLFLFSQVVEVEYMDMRVPQLSDKQREDMANLPVETQQEIRRIFEDARDAKRIYVLRHSGGVSSYLFSHVEGAGNMRSNGVAYYKDLRSGEGVMIVPNLPPDEQVAFGVLKPADWEICTEDTLWVAGFMCLRAVCERESLTAWYAPDLTLSDGPERYSGLPGLILMLVFESNKDQKKIVARKVSVKKGKEHIVLPRRSHVISLETYLQSLSTSFDRGGH